jgi:hypothetical protein
MRTATTATSATSGSATCKRLPQVPLGLSLAARSADCANSKCSLLQRLLYQGRLRSQQLLTPGPKRCSVKVKSCIFHTSVTR